jgi:outer membrane protein assembly factor BamB
VVDDVRVTTCDSGPTESSDLARTSCKLLEVRDVQVVNRVPRARPRPALVLLVIVPMVIFAVLGTSSAAFADDWPTYLFGVERRAGQSETLLSTQNAAQVVKLWSFKTGGVIASQATVVNNVVYIGSRDGYEYALDATTGALKWKTFLGVTTGGSTCTQPPAGVTSTATVVNGVVYVGGGDAYWYALNASTGGVLWRVFTGDNSITGGHYNWASPLISNGFAYIGIASLGDCPLVRGQLLKVDLQTHLVVGTLNFVPGGDAGGGVWTSPALNPATNTIFVTTGTRLRPTQNMSEAMVAIDAASFTIKSFWPIPLEVDQANEDADWGTTPVVFDDAAGRHLVAAISKDGNAYAFDQANVAAGPVWTRNIAVGGACPQCGQASVSSGSFGQGTLFMAGGMTTINGVSYLGGVKGLDPGTGGVRWAHGAVDTVVAATAYVNGLVIDGAGATLELLNASTGQRLWYYTTGGIIYGAPSVSNGRIFVGTVDGSLYAFGAPALQPPPTPTPVPTNTYATVVRGTAGLRDYYRLNEASGTTLLDSAGSRNGTFVGSVALGAAGALVNSTDRAVRFSGGYAAVPNASAAVAGGPVSLETWAILPDRPTNYGAVVGFRNESNSDFYMLQLAGSNILECRFRNSAGQYFDLYANVSPGVYHHLVLVYNGSSQLSMYVDGVLVGQRPASGTFSATNLDLRIARDSWNFVGQETVDEVALYNTSLTSAQVGAHYAAGVASNYATAIRGTAGLKDYYRLDETSGTVLHDSQGALHGTLQGNVTLGVPGALVGDSNRAMRFDGATGFATVPNASAAVAGGPLTLEVWTIIPDYPTTYGSLVGWRNDRDADFYVLQFANSNVLEVRFRNSAGQFFDLNPWLSPHVWHHLAVVYDGASTLSLYIDGNLAASRAANGLLRSTTETLRIANDVNNNRLAANVDEVAVYNTALSAATIASHFHLGSGQ